MSFPFIKDVIENKKIILFGIGKGAEEFYRTYGNELKIIGFSSNDKNERVFLGLSRIELSDLINRNDCYCVIFGTRSTIAIIEMQLSNCLEYYRDYIGYDLFEELYEGKNGLVLVNGTCHQLLVSYGLKLCDGIRNKYIIRFYWRHEVDGSIQTRNEYLNLLKYADYIFALKIDEPKSDVFFPKDMRVYWIPPVMVPHIWPQIIWTNFPASLYVYNQYSLEKSNIQDIRAFSYMDINVHRLIKKGYQVDSIISEISREDFYDLNYLENLRKRALLYNKKKCEESGCYLDHYIEENETQKRMFCDGIHWSNDIAWKVVMRMARIIESDCKTSLNIDLIKYVSEIEGSVWINEYPVYPSVAALLNLSWVDSNTKYNMVKTDGIHRVSFEEYMYDYVTFMYHSYKLQEVW